MAETWQAGSTCKLVSVPWDSAYQRVVNFKNATSRDSYFSGLDSIADLEIEQQTYIRPNVPVTVDAPYSACYGANYIIVHNAAQPVEGARDEWLFYFITNTEYASPASTRLTLQLDVWQTRVIGSMTIESGYLVRGHYPCQAAYRDMASGVALPIILRRWCTAPEGIDAGSSYWTTTTAVMPLQDKPVVLILSTADLTSNPGSVTDPDLSTAIGGYVDHLYYGASVYVLDGENWRAFFSRLSKYPWVSQNIISATVVPGELVTHSYDATILGEHRDLAHQQPESGEDFEIGSFNLRTTLSRGAGHTTDSDYFPKLRCSPYTVLCITNHQGNVLQLKPELLDGENVIVKGKGTCAPPFTRLGIYVEDYANPGTLTGISYSVKFGPTSNPTGRTASQGEWIDNALWMTDFPQLPVVNNSYINYLASTANTRQYQYDSAAWGRAAANATATNAYEQAQRQLSTNAANQAVANDLTNKQQMLSIGQGAIGAIGQLGSLNVLGAASTAASTALNYMGSQLAQNASNATFANNQALASANADANQRLASFIANGNYQNQIQGIMATTQDAELTSPTMSGQFGGNGFAFARALWSPMVQVKSIQGADYERVHEYFVRYGYAYNRLLWWGGAPHTFLNCCNHYSYWKVLDLVFDCVAANETERDAIRGIFAQGVTVYPTVDDMFADITSNHPVTSYNYS